MPKSSGNSTTHAVKGSGKAVHEVTINYVTGHFCSCTGMLSKKKKFGAEAGKTNAGSCKHIKEIINTKFGANWGDFDGKKSKKTLTPAANPVATPPGPSARAQALEATRIKREARRLARESGEQAGAAQMAKSNLSLQDRIAALQAASGGTDT